MITGAIRIERLTGSFMRTRSSFRIRARTWENQIMSELKRWVFMSLYSTRFRSVQVVRIRKRIV